MAFCDILESFNLVQHVKLPTHILRSLLDLVITKVESSLKINAPTEQNFISDHSVFTVSINKQKPPLKRETREVRKMSNTKTPEYRKLLSEKVNNIMLASNELSVNDLVDKYNTALTQTLHEIAPKYFINLYVPSGHAEVSLEEFQEMTESEISKLIASSKPCTCQTDPCTSNLVKENITILLPLITKIINKSLLESTFPYDWKTSIIIHLLRSKN